VSNKIRERIKQAIKEAGLNQTTFASALNLKQSTVNTWVTGKRNPTVTTLKKIATATGKPLNYFFENLGDINSNKDNKGIIGHLNSGSVLNLEKEEAINKKLADIQNNISNKAKVLELKLDLILEKLKKGEGK
jgi:transcriptional regulator with XRE-family HTH domain